MKQITRYHNDINTIPMRQWTGEEMNFFFGVLTQLRDEGTRLLEFNKEQLIEFANYDGRSDRFRATMESLITKMDSLKYVEKTTHSYQIMRLFTFFRADWTEDLSDMTLKIRVSEDFEYILNQLSINFLQFPIEEFTNLRSTYAKTMYRHIKQWSTKGVIGGFLDGEIPKEQLFIMLDVPKSMQRPSSFNAKVLKPIINELSPLFEGLKVKPVKARKAGNPIIAYKFTWKQEKTGTWTDDKYDTENGKLVKPAPDWSNSKPPTKASEQERKDFEAYKEARRQEKNDRNN